MAEIYVDLDLATGLNDGTSWANAYQGIAGFVTASNNAVAGDRVWVKDSQSTSAAFVDLAWATTLASHTNRIQVMGVRSGATPSAPPVQADLVPGHRTGNATLAYAQTSGNSPPLIDNTSTNDIAIAGSIYMYGLRFQSADNIFVPYFYANTPQRPIIEECEFIITGSSDIIQFGSAENKNPSNCAEFRNCKFDASVAGGAMWFSGFGQFDFYDCVVESATAVNFDEFTGRIRYFGCDLTGMLASGMFNRAGMHGTTIEIHNCQTPASHVLATGTATQFYSILNVGSDDQTGLGTGASEQIMELETYEGTVDISETVSRTGTLADDGADGAVSWVMSPDNVSDNYVGIRNPKPMSVWVAAGSKTVTVYFAIDSSGTALQTDEISLEILSPGNGGASQYSYLPDDGAPGDGGGREQLLGTPSDIASDSSGWPALTTPTQQKLSNAISPDYEGWVDCWVTYSKNGGPDIYVDPVPVVT